MLWCKVTHTPIFAHFWCKNYFQVALASGGRQEFELHWHSWHSLCTDLHISLAWVHMAQSPNLTHTHTHLSSSYKLTLWHLTLWTFQSLGLINHEPFFFFCTLTHTHKYHLSRHTHTDSWNVLKGLNVAGDWKVSQNDLSSSDLRDSKREKEAQGGREKKEWGGFDSVCVWEREAFSWGLSAIIRMNLKTGRRVPINKTSGRQAQFYFLF